MRYMKKIKLLIKHIKDATKIVIAYPIANIMKIKKEYKDIWLISERKDEAEDNGYHLFKYIRENHPNEKVYYLIDKQSNSYSKIEKYNNVIQYNSLKHYIYYFMASKHISAFQFFGVPETPFIWIMEEKEVLNNKKIFLQHGIIKEKLPFLFYKNTKYDLFVCGAKREYEYVKENYGYPECNIAYLGLTRFDNLHNYKTKNQILIMPTWRHWLGMTIDTHISKDDFKKSQYFNRYNNLINNRRLSKVLEENNYKLIFYPHPEMQRFVELFKCKDKNISIANRKNTNLQELLKESKVIITDYSSIAFDCAYMRKPLIYYQFDKNQYYLNHFQKGYFDCDRDGFGPVIENEVELIEKIEQYIDDRNDRSVYIRRAEEFFPIYDNKNCQRTYKAIKEL